MPLVVKGDLRAAREACEESSELGKRGHDIANSPVNTAMFHQTAVLTGEFDLALRLRSEGVMACRRTPDPAPILMLASGTAWERMLKGEYDEAGDSLALWATKGGAGSTRSTGLLLLARRGETTAVSRELSELPLAFGATGVDFNNLGSIAAAGELSAEVNQPGAGARVFELLSPLVDDGVVFSVIPPILIPRAAAMAARAAGRLDQAGELLDRAERVAANAGAEPEVGLVALERARLLAASRAAPGDIQRAVQSAADVFVRLDMLGALTWLREFIADSGLQSKLPRALSAEHELSAVELDIVRAFGQGENSDHIADTLLLNVRTVDGHLSRLTRRLGISTAQGARALLETPSKSGSGGRPARRPELAELTSREVEVLGLVAKGLTNQQIADELVISLHTAIRHVANILGKTGAANRTEAARLAG